MGIAQKGGGLNRSPKLQDHLELVVEMNVNSAAKIMKEKNKKSAPLLPELEGGFTNLGIALIKFKSSFPHRGVAVTDDPPTELYLSAALTLTTLPPSHWQILHSLTKGCQSFQK